MEKKMKKRSIKIIILITLLLTSFFQSPIKGEEVNSVVGQNKVQQKSRGLFWKVKGKNGGKDLYLLGSIHMVPQDIYPLDSKIEKAFELSDVLVVEADVADPAATAEISQLVMSKGLYSNGKTLETELPKKLYQKVEQELKKIILLPIAQAKMMKPWLLSITLAQLNLAKLQMDPMNGIDMHFLKKARGSKKITQLESANFQIKLLSGFSHDMQLEFLKSTLENSDKSIEVFKSMVKAWREGSADDMYQITSSELDDSPKLKGFYKKLNDDRNVEMVKNIEKYLTDKNSYFVVVGALHMLGKEGIVSLLTKKGYSVEKL